MTDLGVIRVVLPAHLRALAGVHGELAVEVDGVPTLLSVLSAVEAQHPALRGTMRDQRTLARRAYVRFFACAQDLSHDAPDLPLPPAVASGAEPLLVIGAMAGG